MIARKCDRCNNFYDEYEPNNSEEANAFRTMYKTGKRAGGDECFIRNTYDLCPKCATSLINWLYMTEVEK